MARGNLEAAVIRMAIDEAGMGDPSGMPEVYRRFACALRARELTQFETEFLASALEKVADACPASGAASTDERAARMVCAALLLQRGKGRKTKAEAERDAFARARDMHSLVQSGMSRQAAAGELAQRTDATGEGIGTESFLDAYREWEDKFLIAENQGLEQ